MSIFMSYYKCGVKNYFLLTLYRNVLYVYIFYFCKILFIDFILKDYTLS